MEIKIKEITIDKQAVIPTLTIGATIEYGYYIESPISITGRLLTDNKIVSLLNEYQLNTDYEFGLKILSRTEKDKLYREKSTYTYFAQLTAVLSPKAIEYIENQREKNPEKSVVFSIDFIIKFMEISAEPQNIAGNIFMNIKVKRQSKNFEIKQSDWIKNYSPYLGIGNFLLLELEIPENDKIPKYWNELYDRLSKNLNDMQMSIQNGDWQKTMFIGRKFIEILKFDSKRFQEHNEFKNKLEELFLIDQHSKEGFENFYNGIFYFFQYLSKFAHEKSNQTGGFNKMPIPTKEDAYFVFTLGVGLLNIIGKKTSKGSR